MDGLTVLGLETSCDETAAAVVRLHPSARGGRAEVLSSVVHSQIDDHVAYGGVVPELASRDHVRKLVPLIRQTLAEAGVQDDDRHHRHRAGRQRPDRGCGLTTAR